MSHQFSNRRFRFIPLVLAVCWMSWWPLTTEVIAQNAIVQENLKPGNPAAEWDVIGIGDPTIQGFATDISVNSGATVSFKIATDAAAYRLAIYRMGYYAGMGARLMTTINPSAALPQAQPACLADASTNLIDCGNWAVSASWVVPTDATSGIYFAKIVRSDTQGASHIFFIVRNDDSRSDIVFQTSDTTWQAYNYYGGHSLYGGDGDFNLANRAYKVSYNRPFYTRAGFDNGANWVFNAEYPMVRWLEANGYDVTYLTGVDVARQGTLLLAHRAFLSVGHDEYWSREQRVNVEAARAAGSHLAFFSGNESFKKTRWEPAIDGSATPFRTLVCYRETDANTPIDPLDAAPAYVWTGTWRDPRFSPPADGGLPENALSGTIFMVNGGGGPESIEVPAEDGRLRFWRNTSVASLTAGQIATLAAGTLGYEWDEDLDNGFRPAGLMRLSTTTLYEAGRYLLDYGSTYGSGAATHHLTLYRHSSGALVFSAGTIQWAWGLDENHDAPFYGGAAPDIRMQQATVNLLADMGAQPGSIQSGLVLSFASTDTLAPTSAITSPVAGSRLTALTPVVVTGTATDSGGVVGAVEVSMDGGTTWHPADGRESWTYTWVPRVTGPATVRVRAIDDSGNMESAVREVSVEVVPRSCPCDTWGGTIPGTVDAGDATPVELGVRFRSEVSGFITGIRFYKSAANTGAHVANLWSNDGALLGTATFTSETGSGWQEVSLSPPVAIAANTTYVASYHTNAGHYSADNYYFQAAGVDAPPLHFLKDVVDGPNGVYKYGTASSFPTETYRSSNYWVDVVFVTTYSDTTPPTVTGTSPAAGAASVPVNTTVTATFSEALDASTISSDAFQLTGPGGVVAASVTYDAARHLARLAPSAPLTTSTTYSAVVKGGLIKDPSGNALVSDVTWSFTTASTVPPPELTIWPDSASPRNTDFADGQPVELGVKFRSDIDGYVTGVRFYKGVQNSGAHVANLWDSTGALLASASFADETPSGWQQASFSSPVPITANTVYVASYHTNSGYYSVDSGYFATGGVDNPPLRALAEGVSGSNGVFSYGASSVFPTSSFGSSNYWVDVAFTSSWTDTTPPTVRSTTPTDGAINVGLGTTVRVTFSEPMDGSTIGDATIQLRDVTRNLIAATVTYDPVGRTATVKPAAPLAALSTYTVTVAGGVGGVKDRAGNAMLADFEFSFTTGAPPEDEGPGGPILVVASDANPFTRYYAEILRAEGLNEFLVTDVSKLTPPLLSQYDVAIVGEMTLTPAQVTMLTDWVNAGGRLIAMRPDKQLAGLLGLTDAGATVGDAYLLIDTATAPGAGLVNETIQFHGVADRYDLAGATRVATLYSTAATAIGAPAVTVRNVGRGSAAAFTYDLARSVVYTRQGNPAWSGQERDGTAPIRSDDLFYPAWIDLEKAVIPQADEQQRLLANLIVNPSGSRKPLPRFWYLPRGLKAAVVMTGDDHGGGGTPGRFGAEMAASRAGCSPDNWECVRSTSYLTVGSSLSDADALNYTRLGFDVALHINTGCADWTPTSLDGFYSDQLSEWTAQFASLPSPSTMRIHCIVWSDYDTQPAVESAHGIRLDTDFYFWPPEWIQNRPGLFTGSGLPMRFATREGDRIDVYQAPTQMTDESGQTYPFTIDTLLDNAVGPKGFYGTFVANMHTDADTSQSWSAIVGSAQSRQVPIISASQLLTWLDSRNNSSFGSLTWNLNRLSFSVNAGAGANGLRILLPANSAAGALTGVTVNGVPTDYTTETIKGVEYAWLQAVEGTYTATYGSSVVPVAALSPTSVTFPDQAVHSTTAAQMVTLSNAGGGPLTISAVTITGANAGDFARTTDCRSTLAAGAHCSINVTFTPTATGPRSATLAVETDSAGAPPSVALDGIGIPPGPTADVPSDFTRDGRSDIVWRHATRGEVWLWAMNGASPTSKTLVQTRADLEWEIRGVRDFTGDGAPDILWRNKTTGQISVWSMNGSTPVNEVYVATVDPAYDIVGTGDFNGDGKTDILWRHLANGEMWIWLMDGATPMREVYLGTVEPGYVIKGVGDLNGDHKADIVWHHATRGEVWVWLMDGTTVVSRAYVTTVSDVGYQIKAVADFTGDGKADILWHHATRGEVWLWTMDGVALSAVNYVWTVADTNYHIVATGDYDGDGKAGVLWHHSTRGEVWVWAMDGANLLSQTFVATVQDVGYVPVAVK